MTIILFFLLFKLAMMTQSFSDSRLASVFKPQVINDDPSFSCIKGDSEFQKHKNIQMNNMTMMMLLRVDLKSSPSFTSASVKLSSTSSPAADCDRRWGDRFELKLVRCQHKHLHCRGEMSPNFSSPNEPEPVKIALKPASSPSFYQ